MKFNTALKKKNSGYAALLFLAACQLTWSVEIPGRGEVTRLSASLTPPGRVLIQASSLRQFTGYQVQSSFDLVHWQNTDVIFGPARSDAEFPWNDGSTRFFRLKSDNSLALSALQVDATTIQLNWPPIPTAAEYRVYRNAGYIGSTAGRVGYFLDTGLVPATSYDYAIAAFDSGSGAIGCSDTHRFSTASSSHARQDYKVLAIAFYPNEPDSLALSHIKTYFRRRLDFIRLASINSAILHPYRGDIISIAATPPKLSSEYFNIDYTKLAETPYSELDGYSIVDLVEKGDVDVVWVLDSPEGAVFYENALVGNKDLNPNTTGEKWNPFPARCSRPFFVNSGAADARVYDAYAHWVEGVMTVLCDGYPATWPRNAPYEVYTNVIALTNTYVKNLHLFERFRLADQWNGSGAYASPSNGNCGSSHFPPNARRDTDASYHGDYAYYDNKTWQRYIDSAADDWLRFPILGGPKRKMNGFDFGAFNNYVEGDFTYAASFGASPELHPSFRWGTDSYHQWWFFHLPHNPGVTEGRLNNWWSYLFDFHHFNGDSISNPVDGFSDLPLFAPISGEYGTESGNAEWWGYWHSCSDFGPFGQVSVVSNQLEPGSVREGEYGMKVSIDQESFQYNGRNDVFYPISRTAGWNLSALRNVRVSIKLGLNPGYISGANPVIRLCANPGNRIEFAPREKGSYANLFTLPTFQSTNDWFTFIAPIEGDSNWEVNIVGFVDPNLDSAGIDAARRQLKSAILSEINYVEVSLRSIGDRGTQVSYYLDGLKFEIGVNP